MGVELSNDCPIASEAIHVNPGTNSVAAANKVQSLQWRHHDHDGVSIDQPHGCLLNRLSEAD